jgi:hypothetical protein
MQRRADKFEAAGYLGHDIEGIGNQVRTTSPGSSKQRRRCVLKKEKRGMTAFHCRYRCRDGTTKNLSI